MKGGSLLKRLRANRLDGDPSLRRGSGSTGYDILPRNIVANGRAETPKAYVFHRRALEPAEVTRHEGIPVVTPTRAILGGIEMHHGDALIDQAIDTATRRGLLQLGERRVINGARLASVAAAS